MYISKPVNKKINLTNGVASKNLNTLHFEFYLDINAPEGQLLMKCQLQLQYFQWNITLAQNCAIYKKNIQCKEEKVIKGETKIFDGQTRK